MRFYVSPEFISPDKNVIEIRDKTELHHIRDVMRLKRGASVTVFDGSGMEYSGNIKEINRRGAIIDIIRCMNSGAYIPYKVTLYQAVPKKGGMDFIVQKAVELGVEKIVPVITERTEFSAAGEKGRRKTERWLRIGKAASKQCGRIKLPVISDFMDLKDALIQARDNDMVLFAALDKTARPVREILRGSSPNNIAVFVGPEGDFSPEEVSMAKKEGCRICSLGPLVLRVDTAVIHILSCLSYEYASLAKDRD